MTPELYFAQGYMNAAQVAEGQIESSLESANASILRSEEMAQAADYLSDLLDQAEGEYLISLLREAKVSAESRENIDYIRGLAKGLREVQGGIYDPLKARQAFSMKVCEWAGQQVASCPPSAKDRLVLKEIGDGLVRASDIL